MSEETVGGRVDRPVGPPAPNRGVLAYRLATDPAGFETAFALEWAEKCRSKPWLNGGWGVLELLCSESQGADTWLDLAGNGRRPLIVLDDSHRAVAATVIQWLGTNIGLRFLEEAFLRAGYTMRYEKRSNAAFSRPPRVDG